MFRHRIQITQAVVVAGIIVGLSNASHCQIEGDPTKVDQFQRQLSVPAGPYAVVNTATGQLSITVPIVGWKSKAGTSVDFAMYYSTGDETAWPGAPASGWRHSYHSWAIEITGLKQQWNDPTGLYNWLNATYDRVHGNPHDISKVSGKFRVTRKDQTKLDFKDPIAKYCYLNTITDTRNNTSTVAYDSTYTNLVTRVTDASGRYLTLAWEHNGTQHRLNYVDDPRGKRYDFQYDPSNYTRLVKIVFPDSTNHYVGFSYTGTKITDIYTKENNNGANELHWAITFRSDGFGGSRVTQVVGPNSDEGRSTANPQATGYTIDYGNQYVGDVDYQTRIIKDKLWSSGQSHRVVHLYRAGDDAYNYFGYRIAYVVGSQSTATGSGESIWDANMENVNAFDGCYYAKYEWDGDGATQGTPYDGTIKKYTNPEGKTWQYQWHPNTQYEQDKDNWNRLNLWKITDPLEKHTTYEYSSSDLTNKYARLSQKTDAGGHVTTYSYNPTTYDLTGICEDSTGLKLQTKYEYYSNGNLYRLTDPYNNHTTYEYDTAYSSYVVKETNVEKEVFNEYFYDNTSEYDYAGRMGNRTRSRVPRRNADTYYLETKNYYDAVNRLYKTTNPDSTYTKIWFDANGNVMSVKDENATNESIKAVEYHYDNLGRVNQETRYAQRDSNTYDSAVTTSYCYDEVGSLKWTKWKRDTIDKQISYTYDERNRLIQETHPGSKPGWFKYKYDGNGNITQRLEGNQSATYRTLDFTYDDLGRPDQDKNGSITLADRSYSDDGLLLGVTNTIGYNVAYTYDGVHRIKTCFQSLPNKTLEYNYSAPSSTNNYANTQEVLIHEGNGTTGATVGRYYSEYMAGGDLQYLTSPDGRPGTYAGPKTSYNYNTYGGLLWKVTHDSSLPPANTPASPYTIYTYDTTAKKRLWLSGVSNFRSDGSTVSSFTYEHDYVGNSTRITEESGDYTDYDYDRSYRLRSEQRYSQGASVYTYDYQYDEIGNRKLKKITNSSNPSPGTSYIYSYSDNNLLTSINKGGVNNYCLFQYDDGQGYGVGRLLQKSVGISPNNRTWTFTYDETSKASSVDKVTTISITNPTQTTSFRYDVLGRRVEKTDSSGTVKYFYDGDNLIAEAMDLKNASGQVIQANAIIAWYTPGICETKYIGPKTPANVTECTQNLATAANWKTWYYSVDGLGSTHEVMDDMQRVADAYAYNAWGEEQGHATSGASPQKNPFRFVGKLGCYSDDDTGLVLMGARYYDPLIGRFITPDPARDGLNWYAYADDNPVNKTDPTGNYAETGLDAAGLGYDVYEFRKRPSILGGFSIAADVVAIALPFVPSVGAGKLAYRAVRGVQAAATHIDHAARIGNKFVKISPELREALELAVKRGEKLHNHHLLPTEFASEFGRAGLNIEEYKILLPKNWHTTGSNRIHNLKPADWQRDWNKVWDNFFQQHRRASSKQINHQLNTMMRDFGLK